MRSALIAMLPGLIAAPALAQDPHAGHQMPTAPAARSAADPHAGHPAPAASPPASPIAVPDPHAGHQAPAQSAAPADPHAGHQAPAAPDPHAGHTTPAQPSTPADPHAGHAMPADPHAGHGAAASGGGLTGADLPVGAAPPPPVVRDNLADAVFGAGPMRRARSILAEEHGGAGAAKVQADLLEWAPEGDHYGWEVEGWVGGDINRFAFKTEGEGASGEGVEAAEVQLLYSRAIGRYTDVQAGLRYDLEPRGRAYATIGFDTMFPYWFEAEGALFIAEDGDVLGRFEGSYDWRLAQRLIVQPRAELEVAVQDVPELGIGSGLSSIELGLRLRYEIRREFAPYVGVEYERRLGNTADLARATGVDVDGARIVVGLRAWF